MPTDDSIRKQVLLLQKKYDANNSGYIDKEEKERFIHDLELELRVKRNYDKNQIYQFVALVDRNQIGRITLD